jgi:hypothetical protein
MSMSAHQFWPTPERYAALYREAMPLAIKRLAPLGVSDPDDASGYVHRALDYCGKRPRYENHDDVHLINVIVLKATDLRRDELRRLRREDELEPVVDEDGNEMPPDEALTRILITDGVLAECEQYEAQLPEQACETRLLVQDALAAMSKRERTAWELNLAGYSVTEIAQELGIGYFGADKLLKRGVEKARRALGVKL